MYKPPDATRLRAYVRSLDNIRPLMYASPHYATIHTGVEVSDATFWFRARRVIVTIPPFLAGRIEYNRAMPLMRDRLTQQMPISGELRVTAACEEPFRRAEGVSGSATSDLLFMQDVGGDGQIGVLTGLINIKSRLFDAAVPLRRGLSSRNMAVQMRPSVIKALAARSVCVRASEQKFRAAHPAIPATRLLRPRRRH